MKKILTLLAITTALTACKTEQTPQNGLTEEQVTLIIDNYVENNAGKIIEELNAHMSKMQLQEQQKAMENRFKNPVKPDLSDNTPKMGAEKPVITIVEYSDFECPYCEMAVSTIYSLMQKYEGKIQFAYKHVPLEFHANAKPAAYAAYAANEQNKFWEFHDKLFENQKNINAQLLQDIAKELKLDMKKFNKDMNSKDAFNKVEKDMAEAKKFGIRGTPNFLINGIKAEGALPEAEFVKIIERLMNEIEK